MAQDSATAEAQWVLLIDPVWQEQNEDAEPPLEVVVGGWFVEATGTTSRFHPNPDYQPSQPGLPTDPVDAALQSVVDGEAEGDELLAAMPDIYFGVAMDEDGVAIVAPAPDDVPSLLVTTAPRHRVRVNAASWVDVTVEELADALPEQGVDVLLNPGASASLRLHAVALKGFVARLAEDVSVSK